MRSRNLHLKVLIAILLTLGVAITAYQIFVQGIPVTEAETDDLWNIDAKVDFVATPKTPGQGADVRSAVEPGLRQPQRKLRLQQLRRQHQSRRRQSQVTWSARRANGKQTLYLPPGAD